MAKLEQLLIYPIKSIGGINVKSTEVIPEGFQWDREWMLVDETGTFITQREQPRMSFLRCKETDNDFVILDEENNFTLVPKSIHSLNPVEFDVNIFSSEFKAEIWEPYASRWLSEYLEQRVILVHMIKGRRVKTSPHWPNDFSLNFSDGYPILLINRMSVETLSEWCKLELNTIQFRPSVLISELEPFAEDRLKSFYIGSQKFEIIKPCERCIITTLFPGSDQFNKEPLATLAKHRKSGNSVQFGMYAIPVPDQNGNFNSINLNQELKLEFN